MKRLFAVILILAIACPAFPLQPAFAKKGSGKNTIEAIIIQIEGKVEIKLHRKRKWQDAIVKLMLREGDSLKTGADSWAEIGFGKEVKNVIRVNEETAVEITKCGPVILDLLKGEIRSLIEGLTPGSTFRIKTPVSVAGARGTGWDIYTDGKKAIVDAYEDEVFFNTIDKKGNVLEESIIKAGKRGVLKDIKTPIALEDLPFDKIEEWNKWKELLPEKLDLIRRHLKIAEKPLIIEARKNYDKALWHIKKGDNLFRRGLGRAKEAYEHAENYLIETIEAYRRAQRKLGIDFSEEIDNCNVIYRKVHVKIGQVRRKALRKK
jgi:hypothetical protein